MCRMAQIKGSVALRPYFYLRPEEKKEGVALPRASRDPLRRAGGARNKQWLAERYQTVADELRGKVTWIQLGLAHDPPIRGAFDLRGRTTLRQSAAILANARVFLGEAASSCTWPARWKHAP